jgi:hypothetical protein
LFATDDFLVKPNLPLELRSLATKGAQLSRISEFGLGKIGNLQFPPLKKCVAQ